MMKRARERADALSGKPGEIGLAQIRRQILADMREYVAAPLGRGDILLVSDAREERVLLRAAKAFENSQKERSVSVALLPTFRLFFCTLLS